MTEIQIVYDGPIVNRADAIALGLKFFFTGTPCRNNHVDRRRTDNRTCEECARLRNKSYAGVKEKYAKENPDKVKESKRRWHERNRDDVNRKHRERKRLNPERYKEENRKWWADNRDKAREYGHKRRSAMKGAGGSFKAQDIKKIMDMQRGRCAEPMCRVDVRNEYHIDHIMPVKLGGSSYPSNLQILCPRCNSRKSAKHPIDWARENGRLL